MKKIIKFMLGFLAILLLIFSIGSLFIAPPILLGNYINWWLASLLIITAPLGGYCLNTLMEKTIIFSKLIDFMD